MTLDDTFLPLNARRPTCSSGAVRVAAIHDQSWVAGPGPRAVIWVAGCLRRCPGCMNRALRSFHGGRLFSIGSLEKRILAVPHFRGVTYSGGEPFEQAVPLANLSRRLHQAGLSVAAYSGYTREALQQAPDRFGCLLNEIDVLIDGEYRRDVVATSPWAGSGNQRIHLLTPLAVEEGWTTANAAPSIEISLDDGRLTIAGLSSETDRLLRERLRSRGVLLGTRMRP